MAVVIPGIRQAQRRLRLPLIGAGASRQRVLISDHPETPFAESFRLLALNVRTMLAEREQKALVVLSPFRNDGRSTIAANLAIALAEHAQVVLYDGDGVSDDPLRKSLVLASGQAFERLPADIGQVISSKGDHGAWMAITQAYVDDGSEDIGASTRRLSESGVYSVVDTPPALSSSEAFALAQQVGRVLYVIRNRGQDMEAHRRVRDHLARLNVEILGLVLNDF